MSITAQYQGLDKDQINAKIAKFAKGKSRTELLDFAILVAIELQDTLDGWGKQMELNLPSKF